MRKCVITDSLERMWKVIHKQSAETKRDKDEFTKKREAQQEDDRIFREMEDRFKKAIGSMDHND